MKPEQLSCGPGDSMAAQDGIAPGKSVGSHFLVQSSCSQCSFDKKPQKAGGTCARIHNQHHEEKGWRDHISFSLSTNSLDLGMDPDYKPIATHPSGLFQT